MKHESIVSIILCGTHTFRIYKLCDYIYTYRHILERICCHDENVFIIIKRIYLYDIILYSIHVLIYIVYILYMCI